MQGAPSSASVFAAPEGSALTDALPAVHSALLTARNLQLAARNTQLVARVAQLAARDAQAQFASRDAELAARDALFTMRAALCAAALAERDELRRRMAATGTGCRNDSLIMANVAFFVP